MTLVNCDELNIFVDWFRFCYLINTYNGNEMIFQVPILHRFDDALHFYEYMISYADICGTAGNSESVLKKVGRITKPMG